MYKLYNIMLLYLGIIFYIFLSFYFKYIFYVCGEYCMIHINYVIHFVDDKVNRYYKLNV